MSCTECGPQELAKPLQHIVNPGYFSSVRVPGGELRYGLDRRHPVRSDFSLQALRLCRRKGADHERFCDQILFHGEEKSANVS